ncbi:homoserine O- acetyltransferase [Allomyces arbusculus]|nr:homoserine O- acetyltransferase [Allomyces arbusculus]
MNAAATTVAPPNVTTTQSAHPAASTSTLDPNALNPFFSHVPDQCVTIIPSLKLECGTTLTHVPVAYKTWGKLNAIKTNVILVCHAFSGSANAAEWWSPFFGPGRMLDPRRWFIVCCNALGSPYGTASPVTIDPTTGRTYGATFPRVSIRDTVRLHRHVLDQLGIVSVAFAMGGSMGGMQTLEWGNQFGAGYVRHLVPMATAGRNSAWGIAWGEVQRQAIFTDPLYMDGDYDLANPPRAGLAIARMQAMLTYRSRDAYAAKFARRVTAGAAVPASDLAVQGVPHNDGAWHFATPATKVTPGVFAAQSYLRYQGDKFVQRFDANCYIATTRQIDTQDLARPYPDNVDPDVAYAAALKKITQPTLVIAVASDGLYPVGEHEELAAGLPNGELCVIDTPEGHDGFLLEHGQVTRAVMSFMRRVAPEFFEDGLDEGGELDQENVVAADDLSDEEMLAAE